MCVALPGIVRKINGKTAEVDFNGNMVNARCGLVDLAEGDRVLVHAGCILQKVSVEEADSLNELMKELRAYD
ncbi:MAG: HypC/HybG/HupF family hydrogenase formation chaperone [Lachnospiraceae bacterium]|nr:HypC/HybG/HupF family hydrogenase formation chaperone [Lachnospiraceae bacterium]